MEKAKTQNTDKNNQIRVQKVVNGVKYNVGIHFSETSKETILDKIKKIVVKENEKISSFDYKVLDILLQGKMLNLY